MAGPQGGCSEATGNPKAATTGRMMSDDPGHTSGEEKGIMTKADLVEQVADAVGPRVTKRDCGLVVDAFLDAVKDALAHRASSSGASAPSRCGTARAARPATPGGKPVEVPPRAVPVFHRRDLRRQVTEATARLHGGALGGRQAACPPRPRRWPGSATPLKVRKPAHAVFNTAAWQGGATPPEPRRRCMRLSAAPSWPTIRPT